jgi:hypothetical protein
MSDSLHTILKRQLNKLGVNDLSCPPDSEIWSQLLQRVSLTYTQADDDRYRLERSLTVASEEMQEEISERNQAQQSLLEANRQLERAHDLLGSTLEHVLGTVQRGASREEIVIALRSAEAEFKKLKG